MAGYQGLIPRLMVLTHYVQKHTLELLAEGGKYPKLSLAYEGFMTHLAERDHSPSELAAKLDISKQACNKTLRELENIGFIRREKNPDDSRSVILSPSELGLQLIQDGIEITNGIHQQFADALGGNQLEQFNTILEKVCQRLQIALPALNNLGDEAHSTPTRLNVLLPHLSIYLRQTLMTSLQAKGFTGLKSSFGQVLGMISREAQRIQYIASILGVSKQAVAAMAADLEESGYITRRTDPEDKRQIILQVNDAGKALLAAALASVKALEAEIASQLSEQEFKLLDSASNTLFAQVANSYSDTNVLRSKIEQLSEMILAELGTTGANALAQHLLQITRGK